MIDLTVMANTMSTPVETTCPFHDNVDRRKTAKIAAENNHCTEGAHWVKRSDIARKVLCNKNSFQAGAGADMLTYKNPEEAPVFFLDGKDHFNKRRKSLRFLSPKAVTQQHYVVMEKVTTRLLNELKKTGSGKLEDISFALAVEVVGEILGITESNQDGKIRRILWVLNASISQAKNTVLSRFWLNLRRVFFTGIFFYFDVRPAIKARKIAPKDDAISTYIEEGYSNVSIIIECLTYGSAGMLTTREFITMCAWYMFEDEALRQRFLEGDDKVQLAILMEILRLEPIAAKITRRVDEEIEGQAAQPLPPGEKYDIDIRNINVTEEVAGECPFSVDPERAKRQQDTGRFLSFGDGPHGCPGWQVALHETRIFLEALFAVPGIKLERDPDISWNDMVHGYELRNALISCDKES
jgi:cytochrome P450